MGGFRTNYADTLEATAASFSADGAWSSRTARLGLGGSLATFEGGGWAAQGSWSGARVLAAVRGRGLFVTTDAAGYGFEGGTWAGLANVGAAGAVEVGPAVGTLALSAGGVRRVDETDDLMTQLTARLRRERGAWSVDAWGSLARAGTVRFGDLAAGLRGEWPRFTLDASGGGRFGDLGDVPWAQVRAAVRVAGPGWLEVSAGRYPPDVTGFATGTFVQAGLRLPLGRAPGVAAPPSGPAVLLEHEPDGTVVVTLRVAGREPLEMAGDWNGWTPQRLEPLGGGRWRIRLAIGPGLHRFTLLDGDGNAFVPEGITAEQDDFGTLTGLLSVPRR